MKKLLAILFSMLTTSCLLIVFAVAIAYATFIENDYGTNTAQILIYNARWFEVLLVLLGINLIGGLFYYKSFQLKRWSMVLFHLSFLIILIGAGITRYFSYEGSMHIREGESSNELITSEAFIQLKLTDASGNTESASSTASFSAFAAFDFEKDFSIGDKNVSVQVEDFVPGGVPTIVNSPNGSPVVEFLLVNNGVQTNLALCKGDAVQIDDFSVGFESEGRNCDLQIRRSGPGVTITANDTIEEITMDGKLKQKLNPGAINSLQKQKLLRMGDNLFLLKEYLPKGFVRLQAVSDNNQGATPDALLLKLAYKGQEKSAVVLGKKGMVFSPIEYDLDGLKVTASYGSKIVTLPFSLKLTDFILERYPGSMSPSSFTSEVVLIDDENQLRKESRIYMNNILDYRGYRFFQSSYDQDEAGTVLSVSFDRIGTMVTYLGYLLMSIGMLLSFFNKKSRFQALLRKGSKIKELKRAQLPVFILLFLLPFSSQAQSAEIERVHLAKFDQLLVQDRQGRIEPMSTMASKLVRKLTKKEAFMGKNATEVFLGMVATPDIWKNTPIIEVANSELRRELGFSTTKVAFNQLVDLDKGIYRLRQMVEAAYNKKPNERNKFDKEVINVDERVNVAYQIFNGDFLRIFPDHTDSNQTWYTETDYFRLKHDIAGDEALLLTNYLNDLRGAIGTRNYAEADRSLEAVISFQHEHGSDLILSDRKVKLEILYNKLNIFGFLSKASGLVGFVLLIFHFINIFSSKTKVARAVSIGNWITVLLFVVYTMGIGLRWYISDHAPWSNSYETLIYVGWATMLSGFIFLKKSEITLSVTTILSSLILMVAGMSWLNPEITNLVPVLKSYWLVIHVAIITASYGFLGIAALLGILNLVLMILRTTHNQKSIAFTNAEIAVVIELALIVGLILLTIGAFIGAVWANESWGRYWGWDPKETWALITILVYSFIIHLRKVPGLYNIFTLSYMSVLGFSSVLMTFFGVNYYLSGMHSYGQGDPPPIPNGVYAAILIIVILIAWAKYSNLKFGKVDTVVSLSD